VYIHRLAGARSVFITPEAGHLSWFGRSREKAKAEKADRSDDGYDHEDLRTLHVSLLQPPFAAT